MDRITYLIEKFWQGKATAKEKQEILRYLEQHNPAWRHRMEQAFMAAEPSESDLKAERAEEIFTQIQSAAGISEKKPISLLQRIRPFVRVAAAVILLISGWIVFKHLDDKEARPATAYTPVSVPDTIVHRNVNKEDLVVRLEDGSTVSLTSGSSIAYRSHFDVDRREIFLEGKATFKVAKDSLRPFTVWAEGYATTALGTTFSVSAYHTEVFTVNLMSGKVVVRSSPKSSVALSDVYLKPGEELRVNPVSGRWAVSNKNMVPERLDKEQLLPAGTDDKTEDSGDNLLAFNKTSLDEVFRRVARKYDVDIDLSNVDIRQLSFTGKFQPTDSLNVVIGIICNMNDLIYHEEGRKIRIARNN
ncbi:FecR family protein [Sphingobacterium allocomposti]|uniref:FecR family protein n=1 Tax=Sphingobacterium allocomposti TaxID=415956 RepID=A0A5S5CZI9_9SPHI|nr:FecR domain-containing protein [Sphingobacterium composti Yoo et al. 2007 non Ten et al. 2007]TYP88296.1 FecR family protein [Sphingobacterium composti Yoo et al. 2007 non Ten et al. 2007]